MSITQMAVLNQNLVPFKQFLNIFLDGLIEYWLLLFLFSSQKMFQNPNAQLHTSELYVNSDEVSITNILNTVDAKFTKVQLGSYPDLHNR